MDEIDPLAPDSRSLPVCDGLLLLGFLLLAIATHTTFGTNSRNSMLLTLTNGKRIKTRWHQEDKEAKKYKSIQGIDLSGTMPTPVKDSRLVFILIKLWRSCS